MIIDKDSGDNLQESLNRKFNVKANVVEIVSFKTKPDVSENLLKQAAAKTTCVLEKVDGFLYRQLGATQNREQWVDILYWKDLGSSYEATELFLNAPDCQEFISLIDENSITTIHLALLLDVLNLSDS